MSLDIYFKETKPKLCPHCGKTVEMETIDETGSGGRVWYPILEKLGYYVPYDKRTEENDWYDKDMTLTQEQLKELYQYVKDNRCNLYYGDEVFGLLASAIVDGNTVVINANW